MLSRNSRTFAIEESTRAIFQHQHASAGPGNLAAQRQSDSGPARRRAQRHLRGGRQDGGAQPGFPVRFIDDSPVQSDFSANRGLILDAARAGK